MKRKEFDEIIKEAEKASVEISFYAWTQPKQYRRGIHTDAIRCITSSYTGLEFDALQDYEVSEYEIMDATKLNATVNANTSETEEEGEEGYEEMIVMCEQIEENN